VQVQALALAHARTAIAALAMVAAMAAAAIARNATPVRTETNLKPGGATPCVAPFSVLRAHPHNPAATHEVAASH
jgi:hypothetical protein